jgi:hypothetical protein
MVSAEHVLLPSATEPFIDLQRPRAYNIDTFLSSSRACRLQSRKAGGFMAEGARRGNLGQLPGLSAGCNRVKEVERMRPYASVMIGLMFLWLILGPPSSVSALRCHGRIVSEGALKFDVVAKCGEPTWVEVQEGLYNEIYGYGMDGFAGVSNIYADFHWADKIVIEEWTYNFGPHRLIYYLTFKNGALWLIRTGGRGYFK